MTETTLDFASKPPTMRCSGCGATQEVILPMALSDLGAALEKFADKHQTCEAD
jgi:hypothetical protein